MNVFTIAELEAIGNYANRPKFSDGQETGGYWGDFLYERVSGKEERWERQDLGTRRKTKKLTIIMYIQVTNSSPSFFND
jgi:DUF971 family protein